MGSRRTCRRNLTPPVPGTNSLLLALAIVVAIFCVAGVSAAAAEQQSCEAQMSDGASANEAANNASDGAAEEATVGAMRSVDDDGGDDPLTRDLIAWLVENGANMSDKLEIRRVDPSDPTSPRGIFASAPFEADETIFTVPWNVIVDNKYDHNYDEGMDEEDEDEYDEWDDCNTVWGVYDAMTTKPTPYGRYLASQPRRYVPGYWSKEGREFLGRMLGDDLPPQMALVDKVGYHWLDNCYGAQNDEMQIHAAMVQAARSDNDLMVPLYDMFNHRNGRWYNVHLKKKDGVTFGLVANRRVEAGEELYNSYSQCNYCGDRKETYGTPEIFEEYGFVEMMPQRWIFHDEGIRFDIDERATDAGGGDGLVVDYYSGVPSKSGLDFLRSELARLNRFANIWKGEREDLSIPEGEWDSAWAYHSALVVAITHAIDQAP